jgi:glutaredoxin/glutathione-dependent peroxiredoxin
LGAAPSERCIWIHLRRGAGKLRYHARMIRIGDRFPDAALWESTGFGDHCPLDAEQVDVAAALRGKTIVAFGLPGAFTTTCSNRHVPGYLARLDDLKRKGVDEVWCLSVNDGETMAAWGRSLGALGAIRFLGDGSGLLTKALGLERDLTADGMGIRMRRCSFLIQDGVVQAMHVEAPGKFEVSDAETMLRDLAR